MIIQKLIRFYPIGLIATLLYVTLLSHNANSQPLSERDRASQQAELDQLTRQLKEVQLALQKDIKKLLNQPFMQLGENVLFPILFFYS